MGETPDETIVRLGVAAGFAFAVGGGGGCGEVGSEGGFKKNEITDWVVANWLSSNQSLVAWTRECIMYTIHPPYIRGPVESSRCIPFKIIFRMLRASHLFSRRRGLKP